MQRRPIGVGRAGYPGSPSLRTVLAVLPHTALQSEIHLFEDGQRDARAADRENSPCALKKAFASFHPVVQGRPHPLRPHRRFHPGPSVLSFSGLFSPDVSGHFHRVSSVVHDRRVFSFLCPFAPWALPHFPATMDTLTSRPVSSPNGISVFRRIAFRPFRPQTPHVPLSPLLRYPTSSTDYPRSRVPASPFLRRLAGIIRPNRVRHPADWSFASCCSPPCLVATQLQSASGRRATAWRGLPPL